MSNDTNSRIIKRYQNRKLYDTTDSCYVTLEDIGELVRQGEDIKVIDNSSKEDLTSVTLSQILFEEEKKQKSSLPLTTLTNLVRSGRETIRDLATKAIATGTREVENIASEVSEVIEKLVNRGQITDQTGQHLLGEFKRFMGGVDGKIKDTVKNVSNIPAVQSEVKVLRARIEELERRLKNQESSTEKKKSFEK